MWSEINQPGKVKYVERYIDPLTLKTRKVSITLSGKDTAANRKIAQAELARKIDAASQKREQKNVTLDTLLRAYITYQSHTVKRSTYRRNSGTLSHLVDLFGHDAIVNNVTAQYVKDTLISAGYTPGTMNEYIKRFKAMINWGYLNDYCNNPDLSNKLRCFKDTLPKEKIKDKYLEPEELKKLLAYMEERCPHWYYLTAFLSLTGLRIGEALALEVSDIDSGYIHVTKTYDMIDRIITPPKTLTSTRDVYIQPELRSLLKEYNLWSKSNQIQSGVRTKHLFYHASGGYVVYDSYNKYLRKSSEAVLGRRITPHALRHTHASMLMANGVDIDTISRRLGHENSTITREIYLHVMKKLVETDNEQIKNVQLL